MSAGGIRALVYCGVACVIFWGAACAAAYKAYGATMYGCAGTPTDEGFHNAFDSVRGQPKDGNVRYPYRATLWEHQSWLTPVGVEPGHASEHLHVTACLPQGETLKGTNGESNANKFIDVAVTAHNVSGYRAIGLRGSYVTTEGSRAAFIATQAQLDQITTAMQTSGHLGANRVYLSIPLLPVTTNGLKELRWGVVVERSDATALVERWELDARNYWTFSYPELTTASTPLPDNTRFIRNRTIVNFINSTGAMQQSYHHAGLCNKELTANGLFGCDSDAWDWDDYIAQRPAVWTVGNRVTDGGGTGPRSKEGSSSRPVTAGKRSTHMR